MSRNGTVLVMLEDSTKEPPLSQQRHHKTWQPGQVPRVNMIHRPHDLEPSPYGHGHLGVECPVDRTAYLHGTVGAEKSAEKE